MVGVGGYIVSALMFALRVGLPLMAASTIARYSSSYLVFRRGSRWAVA